jgi:hypothetical protein
MIDMARREVGEPDTDKGKVGDDVEGDDGVDAENAADRVLGSSTTSYAEHRDTSNHPTQRRGGCSVVSTKWRFLAVSE